MVLVLVHTDIFSVHAFMVGILAQCPSSRQPSDDPSNKGTMCVTPALVQVQVLLLLSLLVPLPLQLLLLVLHALLLLLCCAVALRCAVLSLRLQTPHLLVDFFAESSLLKHYTEMTRHSLCYEASAAAASSTLIVHLPRRDTTRYCSALSLSLVFTTSWHFTLFSHNRTPLVLCFFPHLVVHLLHSLSAPLQCAAPSCVPAVPRAPAVYEMLSSACCSALLFVLILCPALLCAPPAHRASRLFLFPLFPIPR